jgi:hypothetical protein
MTALRPAVQKIRISPDDPLTHSVSRYFGCDCEVCGLGEGG